MRAAWACLKKSKSTPFTHVSGGDILENIFIFL